MRLALVVLVALSTLVGSVGLAEPLRYTRKMYLQDLAGLRMQAASMKEENVPAPAIARVLYYARRIIDLKYLQHAFSSRAKQRVTRANLMAYGDVVGPTLPYLLQEKRSWARVIEAAWHPAGVDYRQRYVDEVHGLAGVAAELAAQGSSPEAIARTLVERRRAIGKKYKKVMSQEERQRVFARNLALYGDKWGPTFERLAATHSLEEIIASSARTGGHDLGL